MAGQSGGFDWWLQAAVDSSLWDKKYRPYQVRVGWVSHISCVRVSDSQIFIAAIILFTSAGHNVLSNKIEK